MKKRRLTTLVLAAGEGTRMRSARPKVLHEVAGFPLISHVLQAALRAGSDTIAAVIGPEREDVARAVQKIAPAAHIIVQKERLGTAHAALRARSLIEKATGDLIIAYGDTPLVRPETFYLLRAALAKGVDIAIGAFEAAQPFGYGRIVQQNGNAIAIREEKDATEEERKIRLVFGGLMGFNAEGALALLTKVENKNKAGEYYLTEAVALARSNDLRIEVVHIPEEDTLGVNTRAQLADIECRMQKRLRGKALDSGVTLTAPETVFLSADTQFGEDVVLAPYVVIGPGVKIERGAQILSFSHISGATIGKNARIGPFARVRPGTAIGEGAHVGNFVEVNRSEVGANAEVNHLTYLGDAQIGAGTNIGAGTITCNFDGAQKHKTRIGADVFIGSNATLVAPLEIGDEALVAAGSTITQNIAPGGLAFGRTKEQVVLGKRGAERIRANKKARAARKANEKS